jgi:O-antigen/teichoic acid export membrane protein
MGDTAFRVVKNSMALGLATGLERVIAFVLTLYIARLLGPLSLGEYTLVISFLAIFTTISSFGQHLIVPREVARQPSQALSFFVNSGIIGLTVSLPTTVAMVAIAHLLDYSDQVTAYIFIVGLVLFPETLVSIGEATVQGLEKLEYVTIVKFLTSVFRVGVSLAALQQGYGLRAAFVVWGVSQTIAVIAYLWLVARTTNTFRLRPSPPMLKQLVRSSFIFLVVNVYAMLFRRIDVVLLSKIGSIEAVGIYAAASRLVLLIDALAPAFLLSVFPVLSVSYVNFKERFSRISTAALKLMVILVIPVTFVLAIVADKLLPMLFGERFTASVPVFQVLVWMLIPGLTSSTLFRAILASNNEKVSLLFGAVKAVVNVTLNLLLIPRYGALGASITAVVTQSVALIQVYWFTSNRLFKINLIEIFAKPGLCALVSGLLFLYFWRGQLYLLLPIPLLLYLGLLIALKVLSQREWLIILGLWHTATGRHSTTLE